MGQFNTVTGMPGIYTQASATYRKVFASADAMSFLPGGHMIDGTKTRDHLNTDDITVCRAGLLMGKVTATGKYANSVIGLTQAGVGGAQTTLSMSAAGAAELVRRIGSSGSLTITGPVGAVSGVNQVEAIPVVNGTAGSGTFTLTIEGNTTAAITYNSTAATLVSNINAALNTKFGASQVVASGATLAAIILTFSGPGFSGRPITGHVTSAMSAGTDYTINGSASAGTSTTTTLGVKAVAGGTVRSEVVAYSAVNTTTGAVTITAIADNAVSAVNQVEAMVMVDAGSNGSGTFTITIEGITTAPITYSPTYSTTTTNVNAALDAAFGTSAIVMSGASLAALILTFSGSGYAGRPISGHAVTALTLTGVTVNGSATSGTTTTTTAGVSYVPANPGDYGLGSLIGDTDGSATPVTFIGDGYGVKVTDASGVSRDVPFASNGTLAFPIGGVIDPTSNSINTGFLDYPPDKSLQGWIKASLKAVGKYIFTDDF